MFWIELIIVLAIIFLGVRIGGTFLAMAGGIGMLVKSRLLCKMLYNVFTISTYQN